MQKMVIDFNRWSFDDYMRFIQAYRLSNVAQVNKYLLKVLVSWELDVPLSKVGDPSYDPFDHIDAEYVIVLHRTAMEMLKRYGELAVTDEDKKNFRLRGWTASDYTHYNEVIKEGGEARTEAALERYYAAMGRLMRAVALRELQEGEELNFENGFITSLLVSERVRALYQGKS